MRGCRAKSAGDAGFLEDRHGNRGTFDRVGTGAKFVEQDEGVFRHVVDDGNDALHVGRERREGLFDALFVADIGEYFIKHADGGGVLCRDMKTRLRHEGQQTERFERNCLTAGVRTGDNEHFVILPERNRNRHDGLRVEQRMTCAVKFDFLLFGNLRGSGVHLIGQRCTGENERQFGDIEVIEDDRRPRNGNACGQVAENAFDFVRFLAFEFAQFVVRFDDVHRFDEECRAGLGGIVDQTLDFAAVFRLDGDNEASASGGDNVFL